MSTSLRMKQWMETIFINFRYVLAGRVYYVTLPVFCIAKAYSNYFLKDVINIYCSFCTVIAFRLPRFSIPPPGHRQHFCSCKFHTFMVFR